MRWRRWVMGTALVLGVGWLGAAEAWRQILGRGLEQAVTDQGGQVEAAVRSVPLPLWPRRLQADIAKLTLPQEGVQADALTLRLGTPLPFDGAVHLDGPLSVQSGAGLIHLHAQTAQADFRVARRLGLPLETVTAHARALQAALPGGDQASLAALDLELAHQGAGTYRLSLDAEGVVLPEQTLRQIDPHAQLNPMMGPIRLRAALGFAAPLSPVRQIQPPLVSLTLEEARLGWARMDLSATAMLRFDAAGKANGDIDLSVQGWETMLQAATDAGLVGANTAARLKLALRFSANASEDGALRLSLIARDGVVFLGPIPVGALILGQS